MRIPATGYVPRRLAEIRKLIQDDIRSTYGSDVNLNPAGSPLGRCVDIVSSRMAETEESSGDLYHCFNPNDADDIYLDNLFDGILGIPRLGDSKSIVILTLGGTVGKEIPKSSLVKDTSGNLWQSSSKVIIGAGGTVDVQAACTEYGPVAAGPGEINSIVTPQAGWSSVTNVNAAVPGRFKENSAEYRLRKQKELPGMGSAYSASIRSKIEKLGNRLGVSIQCRIVENREHLPVTVDGYVMYPHSYLVILSPSTLSTVIQDMIAIVIWQNGPPGIRCMGDVEKIVTDSVGESQTIRWKWAVPMYYDVEVTRTPFRHDDDTLVRSIVTSYFAGLNLGEEPSRGKLGCRIINGVSGLDDATVIYTAGGPIGPRYKPTVREIALL